MTMLAQQYLALSLHTRTNRGQVGQKPPFRSNRPKSQQTASKASIAMKRKDAEPAMSMQVVTLEWVVSSEIILRITGHAFLMDRTLRSLLWFSALTGKVSGGTFRYVYC